MAEWIAGATVSRTGIRLDMSELVENGHDVPIRVLVDSAMTGPERVLALSVWAPANPEPLVLEAEFSRHSPRAEVSTRIRLANSQTVVALARLENGSVRRAEARVVVALAACVEG